MARSVSSASYKEFMADEGLAKDTLIVLSYAEFTLGGIPSFFPTGN